MKVLSCLTFVQSYIFLFYIIKKLFTEDLFLFVFCTVTKNLRHKNIKSSLLYIVHVNCFLEIDEIWQKNYLNEYNTQLFAFFSKNVYFKIIISTCSITDGTLYYIVYIILYIHCILYIYKYWIDIVKLVGIYLLIRMIL